LFATTLRVVCAPSRLASLPELSACSRLLHGRQQRRRGCLTVASHLPCSSASTDHGFVVVVCPWCSLSLPFRFYRLVLSERREPSSPSRHGRRGGVIGVRA
jgi:hypothetical protein